jgi:hypothetical protein
LLLLLNIVEGCAGTRPRCRATLRAFFAGLRRIIIAS